MDFAEEQLEVRAGDVTLSCVAMGPRDGPLVVLLHGFPEHKLSWRRQLPALAAAGFRAVAPDMRGYGASTKPPRVSDYKLELLAADVANLIAALGRDKADVVGHDWGAEVAWHFAMWHPQKLRRLGILNVPHPHRFAHGLRTLKQLRKSWYIFFFQLPFLPERFVTDENLRIIFKYTTARRGEYSDEDIAKIQEALRWRSGPINYYRAAARYRSPRWQRIDAPVLVIWGERDRWLGKELAAPDPKWVPDCRVERIAEATHWVHADEPERVNSLLLQFLA